MRSLIETKGEGSRRPEANYNESRQWQSPDGKMDVVFIAYGGPDYEGRATEIVNLHARSKFSQGRTLVMGAQIVTTPGEPEPTCSVMLDAIDLNDITSSSTRLMPAQFIYTSESGGAKQEPDMWSACLNDKGEPLPPAEFLRRVIVEMTEAGVRTVAELPPEIDVRATVLAFAEQMQRGDFGKPQLILKREPEQLAKPETEEG